MTSALLNLEGVAAQPVSHSSEGPGQPVGHLDRHQTMRHLPEDGGRSVASYFLVLDTLKETLACGAIGGIEGGVVDQAIRVNKDPSAGRDVICFHRSPTVPRPDHRESDAGPRNRRPKEASLTV